jgi:hypothetical protein
VCGEVADRVCMRMMRCAVYKIRVVYNLGSDGDWCGYVLCGVLWRLLHGNTPKEVQSITPYYLWGVIIPCITVYAAYDAMLGLMLNLTTLNHV